MTKKPNLNLKQEIAAGMAANLAQTPDLGKTRDDLHKGVIVFPYERHLLFYRKERHGITIVRIL